jgi:hypothetical protein
MLFFIIGEVGRMPTSLAATGVMLVILGVAAILFGIDRWAKKYNPKTSEQD